MYITLFYLPSNKICIFQKLNQYECHAEVNTSN